MPRSAGSFGDVAVPVAGDKFGPVCDVVVGDADEFGEYWCGDVAGELKEGRFAVLVGLDADRDELGADVLGREVSAGDAAGWLFVALVLAKGLREPGLVVALLVPFVASSLLQRETQFSSMQIQGELEVRAVGIHREGVLWVNYRRGCPEIMDLVTSCSSEQVFIGSKITLTRQDNDLRGRVEHHVEETTAGKASNDLC